MRPVLGVNHGNLGLLVEVSPAELPAALSRDLTVNDVDYGYYRADAVVVSTPTRTN